MVEQEHDAAHDVADHLLQAEPGAEAERADEDCNGREIDAERVHADEDREATSVARTDFVNSTWADADSVRLVRMRAPSVRVTELASVSNTPSTSADLITE